MLKSIRETLSRRGSWVRIPPAALHAESKYAPALSTKSCGVTERKHRVRVQRRSATNASKVRSLMKPRFRLELQRTHLFPRYMDPFRQKQTGSIQSLEPILILFRPAPPEIGRLNLPTLGQDGCAGSEGGSSLWNLKDRAEIRRLDLAQSGLSASSRGISYSLYSSKRTFP